MRVTVHPDSCSTCIVIDLFLKRVCSLFFFRWMTLGLMQRRFLNSKEFPIVSANVTGGCNSVGVRHGTFYFIDIHARMWLSIKLGQSTRRYRLS